MEKIRDRIKSFNKNLLPEMIALKYQMMAQNPFRFLRGTCHLFYQDLTQCTDFPDSPSTWICGDLHLENVGSFKGNNRMEYFDLNDFDEAILGPCLWEIARAVTSIFVALEALGFKKKEAGEFSRLFIDRYAETLKIGKAYYLDPRTATGVVRTFLRSASRMNEESLLSKMTIVKNKRYSIVINNQTHFKIEKKLKKELIHLIKRWVNKTDSWLRNYKVIDAAFRVAGTGSIGLRRYMFLLQNKAKVEKFLFLDLKSAAPSCLIPYVKISQPPWSSEAERVIKVKSRMQNVSPALLDTLLYDGQDFVIQELQPSSNKINFETIPGNKKDLRNILLDMAILTASAQLRSGGIQGSSTIDELMVFGNRTVWRKEVLDYAANYSKKVGKDFKQFIKAYNGNFFSR